jgi:glycosyltransferase involved in cell wall biosynthesis
MPDQQELRLLLLATSNPVQGPYSQYTNLAQYVPSSKLIAERRTEPRNAIERLAVGTLRRAALSRWYRLPSLSVEWLAWRTIRSGFRGLVHFMWAERDWGFLDLLLGNREVPLCATFHTSPDILSEIIPNTDRLRKLSAVILMSETQRQFFLLNGVSSERIHIVHHGVDCNYFCPASKEEERSFMVLSVGGYRRDFHLLREVCCSLAPYNKIQFRIVGPVGWRDLFKGMANVEYFSKLGDIQLLRLYQKASCFLIALEAATANNAILEAMACGLPIITQDIGGVREYTDSDCGILCRPQSSEALALAVLNLYDRPDLVMQKGASARQRAERLDWPLVATQTIGVYQKVLTEHGIGKGAVSLIDAMTHDTPSSLSSDAPHHLRFTQ